MKPINTWRVLDIGTGRIEVVRLGTSRRRGRKPTVRTLHRRLVGMVTRPAPRGSVRIMLNGIETSVMAGGAPRALFSDRVDNRAELLARRGAPQPAEDWPPTGQAALWHTDVVQCVPRTGQLVARQLARLCAEDSQVTVSSRSLADAVGHRDGAGRQRAFTERGVQCLTESGWLDVQVTGTGQSIRTTYYLLPGDRFVDYLPDDDAAWNELEADLWDE